MRGRGRGVEARENVAHGRGLGLLRERAVVVHRVAGEVEPRRLALHGHELRARELLHVRQHELRRVGGLAPVVRRAEEVHLAGEVHAALARRTIEHAVDRLHERLALVAHAVEAAGADEALDGAAVEVVPVHAAAELVKRRERPADLPLAHERLDEPAPHALDGHEAEAQVAVFHGEVGVGRIDVRRQQADAQLAALGNVLRDLRRVVEHGGQQCRHVFVRIVALHVRRAVGHDGVRHRVRLVEGVAREGEDLVVDLVGGLLRHTARHRAGDVPLRVSVHEGGALGRDDGLLLLRHGAADHVRLAEREPGQLPEDLDDLLLIDDAAIGHGEDRLEQGVLIRDALRVRRAGEKPRDTLHRPGAVERDDGGDVLDAARAQPHAHGRDARALELEHADGAPGGEHVKRFLVIERDALDLKPRLAAAHLPRRVLEHGEVAQAEKVHLQQTELLERRHLELAHERAVVACQRHVGVHRPLRDDHARRVRGRVARHALDGAGRVDELVQPVVPVVHGAQCL